MCGDDEDLVGGGERLGVKNYQNSLYACMKISENK